jgi:hypothetical protein
MSNPSILYTKKNTYDFYFNDCVSQTDTKVDIKYTEDKTIILNIDNKKNIDFTVDILLDEDNNKTKFNRIIMHNTIITDFSKNKKQLSCMTTKMIYYEKIDEKIEVYDTADAFQDYVQTTTQYKVILSYKTIYSRIAEYKNNQIMVSNNTSSNIVCKEIPLITGKTTIEDLYAYSIISFYRHNNTKYKIELIFRCTASYEIDNELMIKHLLFKLVNITISETEL